MNWRSLDREIYNQVAQELYAGKIDSGLWTKAYSNTGGEKQKAEALYIKYRACVLQDELKMSQANQVGEQRQENTDGKRTDKARRGKTHQCSKCGGIAQPTWGSSKRPYNICKNCFYSYR